MTVTVVTTFVKADASTQNYVNADVVNLVSQYEQAEKITYRHTSTSADGLTETRTRVFANQAAYDAFKLEDVVVKNKALREKWCADNNVKMKREIK